MWMQRASYRLSSILRFHSQCSNKESTHPSVSNGAETVWFIKVVCTLCVYRASTSNIGVIGSDYLRKHLNSYLAFRVIQHLTRQLNNPGLAFDFFGFTRVHLNLIHSDSVFNMLLASLCQFGLHDSAKLVFDVMNADRYLCDSSVLALLVGSLGEVGKFEFAKQVLVCEAKLRDVRGEVVSPSVSINLLNSLVKRNYVKAAVDFFRDHVLRLRSLSPSIISFNIVIKGLCSTGEVDQALQYFSDMRSFGCFPDNYTYSIVINGLCKMGDVDRARKLISEMRSQVGSSPNVVTYTSIISGYSKLGKMDEAVNLLDEMIGLGIRATSVTFNSLINGFAKIGDMVSVFKMYRRMLLSGFQPDVVTYTSLIDGHCRVGELDQSLKLLVEMDEKKLSPSLYTFSILINALCKLNRINEARHMLRKLQMREDIIPQPFIYNPVIDGLCKAGHVDEANIIVGELEAKRCVPDKLTYTILIFGLCMKGKMSEAISMYNKMGQIGCPPDKFTMDGLEARLRKAGMVSEAHKIKQSFYDSLQNSSSVKKTMKQNLNVEIPVAV